MRVTVVLAVKSRNMRHKDRSLQILTGALFVSTIILLEGCEEATMPVEPAAQTKTNVRGELGPPPESDTPSSESETQIRAPGTSATSQASFRDAVVAGGASWEVTRTANPQGSFMLLRNVTDPSDATAVLHAAFGNNSVEILTPRQTKTWNCAGPVNPDDAPATLTVRTANDEVIHEASIRCGDAVYVGRQAGAQ